MQSPGTRKLLSVDLSVDQVRHYAIPVAGNNLNPNVRSARRKLEFDDQAVPGTRDEPNENKTSTSTSIVKVAALPLMEQDDDETSEEIVAAAALAIHSPTGRPKWMPDSHASSCCACNAEFYVTRRRHHCRGCGKIFCASCSSFYACVPRFGYMEPVRLCGRCFYTETDIQRRMSLMDSSNNNNNNNVLLLEDGQRPQWVSDSSSPSCSQCGSQWTLWNRRHHCRGCGGLFCVTCCDFWASIPRMHYDTVQPMCYVCFMRETALSAHIHLPATMKRGDFFYGFEFGDFRGADSHGVVFLGDAMSSAMSYIQQVEQLSAAGFHGIVMEYPGMGARYFDAMTHDRIMESVLKCCNVVSSRNNGGGGDGSEISSPTSSSSSLSSSSSRVVLVGLGMGAHVAMKFCAHHGDRVSHLIAIGANNGGGPSLRNFVYNHLSRRAAWSALRTSYRVGVTVTEEEFSAEQSRGLFFQRWNQCWEDLMQEPRENYYWDHVVQSPLCPYASLFISGQSDAVAADKRYAQPQVLIEGASHDDLKMSKFWPKVVETIKVWVKNGTV